MSIDVNSMKPLDNLCHPVSVIKASKNVDAAKKFEEFLLSESGQKIFEEFGYKKVE